MIDYRKKVEENRRNNFNVREDLKYHTLEELKAEQEKVQLPYAVCALNILGDLNVGTMIRSAVLMGAERFFLVGRRKYDKRSSVGAHNYIDLVRVSGLDSEDDTVIDVDVFTNLMNEYGYTPVFFDTENDALPLDEIDWKSYDFKPCLVFGNEGFGIQKSLLKTSSCVMIHQHGILRSFNVSSAASIAMYEVAKNLQREKGI